MASFDYTAARVTALRKSLSPARLDRYRSLADGDDQKALVLYCWNMSLGQCLYWPLHAFEITLRNALGDAIRAQHGDVWFDNIQSFSTYQGTKPNNELEHIEKAKDKLDEDNHDHTHDNIVAASTLGFWHGLFKQEYEKKLYTPLFADLLDVTDREEAYRKIQQVKRLRNNIAHHEPIIVSSRHKDPRELYKDYKVILKITRWICEDTASWVETYSSAQFFNTWNTCPDFFPTLPLGLKDGGNEENSDTWIWYTKKGPVQKLTH
ncbi:MAG: Abi family protein [Candidatus Melainabacteria bacterium]|nr:Abi family protein [Candidatus Melainabacteria bacterium]